MNRADAVLTDADHKRETWFALAAGSIVIVPARKATHFRFLPGQACYLEITGGTSGRRILVRVEQPAGTGYTVTPGGSISGMTAATVSTTAGDVTWLEFLYDEAAELWDLRPVDSGADPSWGAYGGNHKINTTAVDSVGTGPDTLITYTLPAATLVTAGDRLEIRAFGVTAANIRTKRIKLHFGATVVFDTGALAFSAADWSIYATVVRTGAAAQLAEADFAGNIALLTQTSLVTTPGETLSGTVVIKVTSEVSVGAAPADVTQKGLVVDYFPVGA